MPERRNPRRWRAGDFSEKVILDGVILGNFLDFFQKFFGDADGVPSVAPDTVQLATSRRAVTWVTMCAAPMTDVPASRRACRHDIS